MISYNQMAMQSDAGLDWEKLPDPPGIEFAASFDLEGDWGNCILWERSFRDLSEEKEAVVHMIHF